MDAATLANARTTALYGIGGVALVQHVTSVPSRLGGDKNTWNDGETYTCDLQPQGVTGNAKPISQGGRTSTVMVFMAFLPWNANVGLADRLKIGGKVFDVTGTNGEDSDRFVLEVSLTEVQ